MVVELKIYLNPCVSYTSLEEYFVLNPFASGILYFFRFPRAGLFSVKIRTKFLAIKNLSVNEVMSGQPNKSLIHGHFEN